MLPDSWTPLKYHPKQDEALRHPARFKALACGRGSGKTEISRRRLVMALAERKPWPDPIYFFGLPTFQQAKRVAWKPIKSLVPRDWVAKINESEMSITTVFGSTVYVVGMDKPERVEGVQWDGGILDESADQRPGVFNLSILPALTHRNGWCWRIGVPKRFGVGAAEFKKFYDRGLERMDSEYASWTWASEDIIDPAELEIHRNSLDARDYNEQYRAMWEKASGAVFYAFEEDRNVSPVANYILDRPIIVGSDFNVDPMSWVLGHEVDGQFLVFDEVSLRNTNTEETLSYLAEKYGQHSAGWMFYGDASGNARKTSASHSDLAQIKNDGRFRDKRILYSKKNPAIKDRFSSTNAMLCNAKGVRRCFINPRCTKLIDDLNQRAYKPGTREPNDSGNIGHMTDALGYAIHSRWPVKIEKKRESRVEVYGI